MYPKVEFLDIFDHFRSFFEKIDFLDKKHFESTGPRIEIGAGAFPINECIDGVIASDYVDGSHLGMKLDALDMDLPDGSVGAFYGQNVFHHFDNPEKFFAEADRCLQPGGGIILIEPYFGPFAQAVYKNLSDGESFDKNQKNWNCEALIWLICLTLKLTWIRLLKKQY